ncbi:hypothetical protein NDU88_004545 [Pleurodeles waltl]|uniref:Uncharacterized protein n=1 Tax=Pleurodeles waltl TaxID=8319 RepID=A0AAV7MV82_PLEWA|nr:hypothetical protein NDU88_004545 [Pleurodeles waltl]
MVGCSSRAERWSCYLVSGRRQRLKVKAFFFNVRVAPKCGELTGEWGNWSGMLVSCNPGVAKSMQRGSTYYPPGEQGQRQHKRVCRNGKKNIQRVGEEGCSGGGGGGWQNGKT